LVVTEQMPNYTNTEILIRIRMLNHRYCHLIVPK